MARSESMNRIVNSFLILRLTDDLINEWMKQLKVKRTEYAHYLINKIEDTNRRKTARATLMQSFRSGLTRGF
jgi:hypothetical protein